MQVVGEGVKTEQQLTILKSLAILGYEAEEAIGKSYAEFIHPDDRGATRDALIDSTAKPNVHIENRWRHKEGAYRWIDWASSNDEGTLFATGRDVTDD
ncbi:PAS domain-containing protein [Noviherbaspirillum saxi]|uniref:PAS domain S-box protein n=1 Tax=Noviherbaspirillum saxi TaxID=2320863 RepID=A0A3A3FK81_9BURK|nr:PAS domain-containing protein [Noviherbaspirillum saxi]RJF95928.1 PAS domain S-box protein [Noviherbaspirillum saxi]